MNGFKPPTTTPRKRRGLRHIMNVDDPMPGGRRRVRVLAEIQNEEREGNSGGEDEQEMTVTSNVPRPKPSISELLRAHSHPKPDLTPLPTPPLSLLGRKLPESAPLPPPPPPVLPKLPPSTEPSPLQQMQLLRAQLEATRVTPAPQPPRPKPASREFAQRYTFTLQNLAPLTHHSRTAIISLHPPTHIHLQLRDLQGLRGGSQYSYTVPSNSLPITVKNSSSGTQQVFEIEDLPLKHLHAVRYAKRFVDALRKRSVVAKVEVHSGGVWVGKMYGDGRFEVVDPAGKVIGGVAAGRVKGPRRVVRMYEACQRILQDTDGVPEGVEREEEDVEGGVGEFRIDKRTAFVKGIGWCRRNEVGKGWRMMFLDGVRLEIEGGSGDVLWVEGGERKLLRRGMEMTSVRERVRMFVDKGL